MDKVLLVGEANPYGADPAFALYPAPVGCSGYRLAVNILGLSRAEYLARFDRVNVLDGPRWSAPRARQAARIILATREPKRVVLLGQKVADAFEVRAPRFSVVRQAGVRYAIIPHPSGLCRVWNEAHAVPRARAAVALLEATDSGRNVMVLRVDGPTEDPSRASVTCLTLDDLGPRTGFKPHGQIRAEEYRA